MLAFLEGKLSPDIQGGFSKLLSIFNQHHFIKESTPSIRRGKEELIGLLQEKISMLKFMFRVESKLSRDSSLVEMLMEHFKIKKAIPSLMKEKEEEVEKIRAIDHQQSTFEEVFMEVGSSIYNTQFNILLNADSLEEEIVCMMPFHRIEDELAALRLPTAHQNKGGKIRLLSQGYDVCIRTPLSELEWKHLAEENFSQGDSTLILAIYDQEREKLLKVCPLSY